MNKQHTLTLSNDDGIVLQAHILRDEDGWHQLYIGDDNFAQARHLPSAVIMAGDEMAERLRATASKTKRNEHRNKGTRGGRHEKHVVRSYAGKG